MKKTGWFPASIDPVHVGMYEVTWDAIGLATNPVYRWWNGKKWEWIKRKYPSQIKGFSGAKWRGLTEKAK